MKKNIIYSENKISVKFMFPYFDKNNFIKYLQYKWLFSLRYY